MGIDIVLDSAGYHSQSKPSKPVTVERSQGYSSTAATSDETDD